MNFIFVILVTTSLDCACCEALLPDTKITLEALDAAIIDSREKFSCGKNKNRIYPKTIKHDRRGSLTGRHHASINPINPFDELTAFR